MAKTRNHSVRFEQSEFDFIRKREKLTTAQSVVSFLMDNYIKIYKVEKKSIFLVEEEPKDNTPKSNGLLTDESYQRDTDDEKVTFQDLLNGMVGLEFPDDKQEYALKIKAATHLKDHETKLLLTNLWT